MFGFTSWKIRRIIKKIKSMQIHRINNQPNDELIKKEILYYFQLANIYNKLINKKRYPYALVMLIECYRGAAGLNDSAAHYHLGSIFLEEAKYRQQIQEEGVITSEANVLRSQHLFEEALAHLIAAEQLGHAAAKRLKGLCYINGWGINEDKNAGFDLVVASIEQEGSWDKVPQIFAAIGLNKPEFFAAMMQRRK